MWARTTALERLWLFGSLLTGTTFSVVLGTDLRTSLVDGL